MKGITYFGGFTSRSTLLDVLKYFNDKTSVTDIKLQTDSSTSLINYKNKITMQGLGQMLDNCKMIKIETVTNKEGKQKKLYASGLVAVIKYIVINEIPFDVRLTFKMSEGFYFLNSNKAFTTPKGIDCLYYLDSMRLITHNSDEAHMLSKKNRSDLLSTYEQKYSEIKGQYKDDGHRAMGDTDSLIVGYEGEQIQILLYDSTYYEIPIIDIRYNSKIPMAKEDKEYNDFIYKFESQKNKKFNMNDEI